MRKAPQHITDPNARLRLGEIAAALEPEYARHAELKAKRTSRTKEENAEMVEINKRVHLLEKEWKDLTPTIAEALVKGQVKVTNKD